MLYSLKLLSSFHDIITKFFERYRTFQKVVPVFRQSRADTSLKFLHTQKQLDAQVARYTKKSCLSATCPNLVLCFFVLLKLGTIIQLIVSWPGAPASPSYIFTSKHLTPQLSR